MNKLNIESRLLSSLAAFAYGTCRKFKPVSGNFSAVCSANIHRSLTVKRMPDLSDLDSGKTPKVWFPVLIW